jgi:hypothetical protein
MKINLSQIVLFFSLSLFAVSCSNDDSVDLVDETLSEFKHLRILVSDETTTELTLVNPFLSTTTTLEAKFPKSALYTAESGRFGGVIHRENDLTETFDTGLEFHGDHVDVKGTPKFGALTGVSSKPTHFKSNFGEILTFNDGDGTLAVGLEADIHKSGAKMKIINAGLKAHHGAMAVFSNGTYAITEKDNSIPGTLPERVKIIDKTGKELFASSIATKGIHGNASDGEYAVFGSASGILVVNSKGEQNLIAHPEGFGTIWFGTILETAYKGNFVGFTASKGAYLINVVNKTIKPIVENTDIMQCKVSYDNKILGVLLHSGNFITFDLKTLSTATSERNLIPATAKDSKQKPQLELTQRFAYVTLPATGELQFFGIKDNANSKKIKVSNTPYRLTIMGFENSGDH